MFNTAIPRSGFARLRQVADGSLFALLVLAPLVMGGRHPIGWLVFSVLISFSVLAAIWSRYLEHRREWHWTGLEWLLLATSLVIGFQWIPLPQAWLTWLSPALAERLPLWSLSDSARTGLGEWSCISLHPDATRNGHAIFCAYAILFLVTAQQLTGRQSVERVLKWVAAAVVFVAIVALAQFLAGTDKFLWIYEHPSRAASGVVRGPFANQNHLAHMLALGVGPLIWWLCARADGASEAGTRTVHRSARDRRATQWWIAGLGIGVGLVLLAAVLTFSRAGVVAVLLAVAITVITLAWAGRLGQRGWAVAAVMATLLFVALAVHGFDRWGTRIQTVVGAESLSDVSSGRQQVWSAVQRAVGEFPLLGSGVGTHRDVYPMYLDQYADVEYTHAESGYLQILEEMGVVGLSLLLVAVGVVGNWCRKALLRAPSPQARLLAGAVTASLLVSALHSLVDFVWYIPACMTITIVLAACLWRLSRLATQDDQQCNVYRIPRPIYLSGAVAVSFTVLTVVALAWGPARAAPHWDRYVRLVDVASPKLGMYNPDVDEESVDSLINCLEHVVDVNRRDSRAHARLAALSIQKFNLAQQRADNVLGVTEIRDAAILSEFPSLAAQDQWLNRAVPQNRHLLDSALQHARRAVQLAPLQGESYVFLAQLGFLEGDGRSAKWAYLEQALRVRPHDDNVLMAAGSESALEGDMSNATACWRQVFVRNPIYREQIVASFAPRTSADQFLKTFEPDVVGAESLYRHYCKSGRTDGVQIVGRYYVAQLESLAGRSGSRGSEQWWRASKVQTYLGDDDAALASLHRAADLTPSAYHIRQALARKLMQQKRYAEAREHLQWCLRRKPQDDSLRRDLQVATRAELGPMFR